MDGLYDGDVLVWSGRQAGLLRRLAAGERVNDEMDWGNVIEEIGDVGAAEVGACWSLLRQALVHLLKLRAWPASEAAGHWRQEALTLLADAGDRFTPAMRDRIDLERLYGRALNQVEQMEGAGAANSLPAGCPFTLDDLLDPAPRLPCLLRRMEGADGG